MVGRPKFLWVFCLLGSVSTSHLQHQKAQHLQMFPKNLRKLGPQTFGPGFKTFWRPMRYPPENTNVGGEGMFFVCFFQTVMAPGYQRGSVMSTFLLHLELHALKMCNYTQYMSSYYVIQAYYTHTLSTCDGVKAAVFGQQEIPSAKTPASLRFRLLGVSETSVPFFSSNERTTIGLC